jgi:hypothetical protein
MVVLVVVDHLKVHQVQVEAEMLVDILRQREIMVDQEIQAHQDMVVEEAGDLAELVEMVQQLAQEQEELALHHLLQAHHYFMLVVEEVELEAHLEQYL